MGRRDFPLCAEIHGFLSDQEKAFNLIGFPYSGFEGNILCDWC